MRIEKKLESSVSDKGHQRHGADTSVSNTLHRVAAAVSPFEQRSVTLLFILIRLSYVLCSQGQGARIASSRLISFQSTHTLLRAEIVYS